MKITLAGNEYTYFESVFDNLKFLFGKWKSFILLFNYLIYHFINGFKNMQ